MRLTSRPAAKKDAPRRGAKFHAEQDVPVAVIMNRRARTVSFSLFGDRAYTVTLSADDLANLAGLWEAMSAPSAEEGGRGLGGWHVDTE